MGQVNITRSARVGRITELAPSCRSKLKSLTAPRSRKQLSLRNQNQMASGAIGAVQRAPWPSSMKHSEDSAVILKALHPMLPLWLMSSQSKFQLRPVQHFFGQVMRWEPSQTARLACSSQGFRVPRNTRVEETGQKICPPVP